MSLLPVIGIFIFFSPERVPFSLINFRTKKKEFKVKSGSSFPLLQEEEQAEI